MRYSVILPRPYDDSLAAEVDTHRVYPGRADDCDWHHRIAEQAIQNGTLWKYTQNSRLYRCPGDPNPDRLRSYSINTYLCSGTSTGVELYFNIYKITQANSADTTLAFVEEGDPRNQATGAPIAALSNGTSTAGCNTPWLPMPIQRWRRPKIYVVIW